MPKSGSSRHRQLDLLSEMPKFQEGQQVVRITKACGENIYEAEKEDGETTLYRLPSRLRNVAFIRRGSFVFVRDDLTIGPGKVRGDIEAVVMNHYLRTLQKESFWPSCFKERSDANTNHQNEARGGHEHDSDWEIGEGNPNRRIWEEESESEGEDE